MKWKKVKVGDFLIRVKDLVQIKDNDDYNLVTIKLYHKGVKLRKKVKGSEMQADKMSRVKAGQFILSGIDARNGAFGIIPEELDGAVVTNDFWHFEIDKNFMSNEYFLWLTSTPYFDDICNKASDGTTNRIRLQSDRFYSQELMIPEVKYQHELVEKLKSTDEKIKNLYLEYNFQLTQITNLNQAILQEAVQGKLVKQNPKDEPATELLKRIKEEKLKSNKKEKPLPPIKPEEIPFEIPESWVWCRLGEIIHLIMGQSPESDTYNKKGLGLPFYQGKTEFGEMFPTTVRVWCTKPTRISQLNDILISVRAPVGDVNISDKVYATGRGLSILRCLNNDLHYLYLFYFLDFFKRKWNSKGSFFQAINRDHIELQPFPLPPLSEQKRIVAEIEKQLAKTKQLKEHIIANQQATEQLLKALLHQAFEVEEK